MVVFRKWQGRRTAGEGPDLVFHAEDGSALSLSGLDRQHATVRETLNAKKAFHPKAPAEFVLHSLLRPELAPVPGWRNWQTQRT